MPLFLTLALSTTLCAANHPESSPANNPSLPSYVITNDDLPFKTAATSGSFFPIASDGTLQNPNRVSLGGSGAGGGYFTAGRVSIFQNDTEACAYLSLGGAGEVGAVDINAQLDIGNFPASSTDSGVDNGIGLVNNGSYLYANFSSSNTVATFAILPGCSLSFLGDISPIGKHLGNAKGMAAHGNLLVIAYGDGSIESFTISAGIPVSNGDLQDATGYRTDQYPTGVDITQDGHYAIFGDASNSSTVEVSDISSGKLTKTVLYNAGSVANSNNVILSPDESLIFISNNSTGRVTAAFFDKTSGKVTPGCSSATLKGFDTRWIWLSSPASQLNTGTGGLLYVAEFGPSSGIAMINVTVTGTSCTLTEAAGSPVIDPNSTSLLSIGVFPPRSF